MVKKYHLDELKDYYNQEIQRKESLENKSSYMLAISSILLTIFVDILVNLVGNQIIVMSNILVILSTIFIISSIVSILFCMVNVTVLILKFPVDISSIQNIKELGEDELCDELYDNYTECIKSNVKKIDNKICLLNIVYVSNIVMLLSLLLFLMYLFIVVG